MIEKESPWSEDRTVTICSGADLLLTRDAAEEAVRTMIEAAPPAANWIQTTYDGELDEGARDTVDRLRFVWDDEELPLADLTMDVEARPRRRVSAQEAAEDVERLFYPSPTATPATGSSARTDSSSRRGSGSYKRFRPNRLGRAIPFPTSSTTTSASSSTAT